MRKPNYGSFDYYRWYMFEQILDEIIQFAVDLARRTYSELRERREAARRDTQLRVCNPEPTPAGMLAQWDRAKTSLLEKLRFGSMLSDLEKHVDSSVVYGWSSALGRFTIVARNPGLKGWLSEHCGDIVYKTAMGYKDMAKRARRVCGLPGYVPLDWAFSENKYKDAEHGGKFPISKIRAARTKLVELLNGCGTAIALTGRLDSRLEIKHRKLSKPRKGRSAAAKMALEDRRVRLLLRTATAGISRDKLKVLIKRLQDFAKKPDAAKSG